MPVSGLAGTVWATGVATGSLRLPASAQGGPAFHRGAPGHRCGVGWRSKRNGALEKRLPTDASSTRG